MSDIYIITLIIMAVSAWFIISFLLLDRYTEHIYVCKGHRLWKCSGDKIDNVILTCCYQSGCVDCLECDVHEIEEWL